MKSINAFDANIDKVKTEGGVRNADVNWIKPTTRTECGGLAYVSTTIDGVNRNDFVLVHSLHIQHQAICNKV